MNEQKFESWALVELFGHQRNGETLAKNYHACPTALLPHLEAAIKARFSELLADAMTRQDKAVKAAAAEAVIEHRALLDAAGLEA